MKEYEARPGVAGAADAAVAAKAAKEEAEERILAAEKLLAATRFESNKDVGEGGMPAVGC